MQETAAQLEFVWRDEGGLQHELEANTGHRIELVLTDNASSIMSYRAKKGRNPARLRLHRMFLTADQKVVRALSTWLVKDRSAKSAAIIDEFIHNNGHMIRSATERAVRIRTRGRHFDLQALYDAVNDAEFGGVVNAPITWGRIPTTRRRNSIRLGSFTPEDNLIRIHPFLDQDFVPEFFVRYVVFHEMLHAYLGVEKSQTGRRCVHTRAFKRRERAYSDYDRAIAWHNTPKYLNRLLRTKAQTLAQTKLSA